MVMRIGALNVGHGYVKGMVQVGGDVRTFVYPAWAVELPPGQKRKEHLRVVEIGTGDRRFLIGPDTVKLTDHRYDSRLRSREYPTSAAYRAHCDAGLTYMREAELDVLVIALPLSTLDDLGYFVEQLYSGTHVVPNLAAGGRELMSVRVKKVIVMAEPCAALIAAYSEHPKLAYGWTLAVDIGFHTTDHILAHELEPNSNHSGVIESACCEYVNRLARAAQVEFASQYPTVHGGLALPRYRFEQALEHGATTLNTPYGPLSLKSAAETADKLLDTYWTTIESSLFSVQEVDHIVVAGGAAERFARVFHKRHPRREMPIVASASNPQLAVVRGMLLAGVDYYRQQG